MPTTEPVVITNHVTDSDFLVSACLLALASNVDAKTHLAACRHALRQLGELVLSPVFINECQKKADGIIVPAYHNQMAVLILTHPMPTQALTKLAKQLEQANGRASQTKPLVTLDVDLLAVKAQTQVASSDATWTAIGNGWLALARRLPLANYDQYGLTQLPLPYPSDFSDLLTQST